MKNGLKWKIAQKMELKWWQHYLKEKDPNEYLSNKRLYWDKLLVKLPENILSKPNQIILDAGCGPAGIFISLNNHQVIALDPLIEQYKLLPHFNPANYPWTKFIESPLELIDEKQIYDTIFCINAINHVNDISLCCRKLSEALKDGGYLVLSTDAHWNFLLKKIFQWFPGDVLHPIQLNIDEYQTLLREANFELIETILFKKAGIFNYYIIIAQKKSS